MSDKTPTPASKLKALWRKARSGTSLKVFTKALVSEGHELATDATKWLNSKLGKLQTQASAARLAHHKAVAATTRATKSKKK